MYSLFDLPFELFSVIMIAFIPTSLVVYFNQEKRNPGNPMNKMLWAVPPMSVVMFLQRCSGVMNVGENFRKTMDFVAPISFVLFFVGLTITWILSYKRGYIDRKEFESRKTFRKACVMLMVVGWTILIILIVILKLEENNMLP